MRERRYAVPIEVPTLDGKSAVITGPFQQKVYSALQEKGTDADVMTLVELTGLDRISVWNALDGLRGHNVISGDRTNKKSRPSILRDNVLAAERDGTLETKIEEGVFTKVQAGRELKRLRAESKVSRPDPSVTSEKHREARYKHAPFMEYVAICVMEGQTIPEVARFNNWDWYKVWRAERRAKKNNLYEKLSQLNDEELAKRKKELFIQLTVVAIKKFLKTIQPGYPIKDSSGRIGAYAGQNKDGSIKITFEQERMEVTVPIESFVDNYSFVIE